MARGHKEIPKKIAPVVMSKATILKDLVAVDGDADSRARVLELENGFRMRVAAHVSSLPLAGAKLDSFKTSPFVLLVYAHAKGYTKISQIEEDILPAKLFSSMETSAGRMVEDVALPVYGWQVVPSGMHSANSALDGKIVDTPILRAVTLKSGPRCLNDEMSENFADNVVNHGAAWLSENYTTELDFTYGVLYGTPRQSNKKDWHILRKIAEKVPADETSPPWKKWECSFRLDGMSATATVRIGKDWWDYLGGPLCLTELCVALIRACVAPGTADGASQVYTIGDMADIVQWPSGHAPVNVAILQASQVPWLFFLMRHFCDELTN